MASCETLTCLVRCLHLHVLPSPGAIGQMLISHAVTWVCHILMYPCSLLQLWLTWHVCPLPGLLHADDELMMHLVWKRFTVFNKGGKAAGGTAKEPAGSM